MKLPSTALTLASHPSRPLLAVGLVEGGVACGTREQHKVISLPGATRALSFVPETSSAMLLFAASDAGHLSQVDVSSGTVRFSNLVVPASEGASRDDAGGDDDNELDALSAITALDEYLVLAGTDNGSVLLFDMRTSTLEPVASILEQGDYISAIRVIEAPPPLPESASAKSTQKYRLAVSSGDGSLCVYDVRTPPRPRVKLIAATPGFDDDLLSLQVMGGGARAVGGTLSGAVNVYDMRFAEADEEEEDMSRFVERFHGHPESVSALLAYGEQDIVLTGSSDGLVRVVDYVDKNLAGVLPYVAVADDDSDSQSDVEGEGPEDEEHCSDDDDRKSELVEADGVMDETEKDNTNSDAVQENDNDPRKQENMDHLVLRPITRRPRSKYLSWPIEGMAVLRGSTQSLLAVIGHTSRVRFCDLSVLDDDDDNDGPESGKQEIEGEPSDSADEGAVMEVIPPPSKRRKGQKASRANSDAQRLRKQKEQQAFFSGL